MPRRNVARSKVTWTDAMNQDLLKCRDEAKIIVSGENAPRKESGRKIGYMEIMRNLFLERYPELEIFTAQNLRDKISHAEKVNTTANYQTSLVETFNLDVNTTARDQNSEHNLEVLSSIHCDHGYVYTPMNAKECQAFNIAKDVLIAISTEKGDMSNRHWKTRNCVIPSNVDVMSVNKIVKYLLTANGLGEQFESNDFLNSLWNLNCIVYAAVIGWYRANNIKCKIKTGMSAPGARTPKWLNEVNNEISETRKLLSKCVAELDRITRGARMTRKTKRNRKLIGSKIGVISSCSLTKYIMKLKARVRRLSKTRKKKLKNDERRQINNNFHKNQSKVFSEFKEILKKAEGPDPPSFQKVTKTRKFFENSEDVLKFWKSLWEKDDQGKPNVDWLREYEILFKSIIPEIHTGDIEITDTIIWNSIKKKRNWSAPGPDLVVNYWLKKLFVIHKVIKCIFMGILNFGVNIDIWYAQGRTSLIEKDENFVANNTRPITCTINMYKWFTSVLLNIFNQHVTRYNIMQMDQRGAKSKCSGTFQNILIDDMVLKDAHDNKRNLTCSWVDISKAFDSLSHSWIVKMLEIHRFPSKLTSVIAKIMSSWNIRLVIPLAEHDVISEPIFIKSGVLQGDVICPNLYTLSTNPMSWELRRFEGYKLSKPLKGKITHVLFIDDLKTYNNSQKSQCITMSHAKSIMQDAGLTWNVKKTKVANIKRGIADISESHLQLNDASLIPYLESEDSYKFLGILEHQMHDTHILMSKMKEIMVKRANVVWSSPLSDINKVLSTNIFVQSCLEYFMWTERFNITDLREIDTSIRNVMNQNKAKYKLQVNSSLYLPRSKGGRGLKQVEYTYKCTRIKAAVKILTDKDPEMVLVKHFDKKRMQNNRCSIINDAIVFSRDDFHAEFVPLEDDFIFKYWDGEHYESTSDIKKLTGYLKKEIIKNLEDEMSKTTWQGETMKARNVDPTLIRKDHYLWNTAWKDCPVEVMNDIHSMILQIVPTLAFEKYRSKPHLDNTLCRLCHKSVENIPHLLNSCEYFLSTLYMNRHNKVLQYIYFNLLVKYGLLPKCPPWYSCEKMKPLYENEKVSLFWDIPEYLGYEDEDGDKMQRPDGKLILNDKMKILILEMSVPWISNREVKLLDKQVKYRELIVSMKGLYPNHQVEQVTFIVDSLGGYSQSMVDALKYMEFNASERNRMLLNIQKIVLSESRYIINRFKQLTKN